MATEGESLDEVLVLGRKRAELARSGRGQKQMMPLDHSFSYA